MSNHQEKGVIQWQPSDSSLSQSLFQTARKKNSSRNWKPFAGNTHRAKPFTFVSMWRDRHGKGGETMDGYKRLSVKEADLVWDRERFKRMPEQERELLLEETRRASAWRSGSRRPSRTKRVIRSLVTFMTGVGIALTSKIASAFRPFPPYA